MAQYSEDAPFNVKEPKYYAVVYIRKFEPEYKKDVEIGCGYILEDTDCIIPVMQLVTFEDGHLGVLKDGWSRAGNTEMIDLNDSVMLDKYSWFSDLETAYPEFKGYRKYFDQVFSLSGITPISLTEERDVRRCIEESSRFKGIKLSTLKKFIDWINGPINRHHNYLKL